MEGKVKWFSQDKGYGFLFGDDGQEYHCSARDVMGSDLPANGDRVAFDTEAGKKGPRAVRVRILARGKAEPRPGDERVQCKHCGKRMVPRIAMQNGAPWRSYCPFCGGLHQKFGMCFIATAVYQDAMAPEVCRLRQYRDERLMTNRFGRGFVGAYYRLSPPVASWLGGHSWASHCVKIPLDAWVRHLQRDDEEKRRHIP